MIEVLRQARRCVVVVLYGEALLVALLLLLPLFASSFPSFCPLGTFLLPFLRAWGLVVVVVEEGRGARRKLGP